MPKKGHTDRGRKGRCRVPTGGSTRGTTLAWGDYGVRLRDYDQKISAKHLEIAMATLKVCLRGERYRVYTRVAANTGVYKSGNQVRMGKGKGKFDHWTARVAVSQIVFEVSGTMHEEVARNAMRIVGNKLPGELALLFVAYPLCLINPHNGAEPEAPQSTIDGGSLGLTKDYRPIRIRQERRPPHDGSHPPPPRRHFGNPPKANPLFASVHRQTHTINNTRLSNKSPTTPVSNSSHAKYTSIDKQN